MTLSFFGLFGAGLLTFLSPCVLPLIPILLAGLMIGQPASRRVLNALWFVSGFTIVFVLMGLSVSSFGKIVGMAKPWLLIGAGIIIFLFGLKLAHSLPHLKIFEWMNRSLHVPDFTRRLSPRLPKGLNAFLFGSIFGLSWTPCVGPILGGVLTYVASKEATAFASAMMLLPFALGIGVPVIIVAWSSDKIAPHLKRLTRHLNKIEIAVGLGLAIFGLHVANQGRIQSIAAVRAAEDGTTAVTAVNDHGAMLVLNSESKSPARVVFFYSEGCPICHQMEEYLPELEADCSKENFELVRINVDRPENGFAARSFNVRAVPTLSILNDRGDETVHLVGYQTRARLLEALRTTSKLACKAVLPSLPKDRGIPMNSQCTGVTNSCE